jgi:hypothetical protein
LVVVHTYLTIWVRDYVNRKLSEIHGYRAHVAAATLQLWRGAYQIHYLDIKKTSGKVPVPFFSAPLVDLSVQWRALIFERFRRQHRDPSTKDESGERAKQRE